MLSKWATVATVRKPRTGSALRRQFLLFGKMGGCSTPGGCREECGTRERKHLDVSLLPLIGAENKTEIQLESKARESLGKRALRQPPSPVGCLSTSSCPCHGDLPLPWAGHLPPASH